MSYIFIYILDYPIKYKISKIEFKFDCYSNIVKSVLHENNIFNAHLYRELRLYYIKNFNILIYSSICAIVYFYLNFGPLLSWDIKLESSAIFEKSLILSTTF